MNTLPRKILGYKTPEQLFEEELDLIYAVQMRHIDIQNDNNQSNYIMNFRSFVKAENHTLTKLPKFKATLMWLLSN